ncbi:hydratase [Motilimonas cestriensis]|uniref:hydratase n=1 Tax=Motilimonas cestriensis TaxID=2742685 RepID=UPI003DA4997B
MLNPDIEQAAQVLASRRFHQQVGPFLPQAQRPNNFNQAFAIQQACAKHYSQLASTAQIGWKCAQPNGDKTIIGALFESEIQHQTTICPLASTDGKALIEPELCFTLKSDLPPRAGAYSQTEIDDAIGSTRLALELIQSRYEAPKQASFFDALADGLLNQGVWLGPEIKAATDLSYSEFELTIAVQGEPNQVLVGKHQDGHARAGLYWLVNFLSQRGIGLSKGQQVITGSYAGVISLPFNKIIHFQYGKLGEFQLEFRDIKIAPTN